MGTFMCKNILRFVIFFLPLIGLVLFFNYRVDPAGLLEPSGKYAAELMLAGNNAAPVSGNLNEREKMDYLLQNMDAVEYAVLGPSLSITVDKEMAHDFSFANLSISGMKLIEFLRAVAIMDQRGILPEKMLVCFDMSWFTTRVDVEHFSELLASDEVRVTDSSSARDILNHWERLLSLTYFQDSISSFLENGMPPAEKVFVPPADYTGAYWQADGTRIYAQDYQNTTADTAKQIAQEYTFSEEYDGEIDEHNIILLEESLSYLQQQGVAIKIMQVPYHPILWERVQQMEDEREKVMRFEEEVLMLAECLSIPVVGSQCYQNLPGCSEEDFWDARHMRRESIRELFDLRIGE